MATNPLRRLVERVRGHEAVELTPEQAYNQLLNQPKKFLKRNIVSMQRIVQNNGQLEVWFCRSPIDHGPTPEWIFARDPTVDVEVDGNGPFALQAHGIATISCTRVDPTHLMGSRLEWNNGLALVLTAPLSGCSFVYVGRDDGAFRECTHIQPLTAKGGNPEYAGITVPEGTTYYEGIEPPEIQSIPRDPGAGRVLQRDLLAGDGARFGDQPNFRARVFGRASYPKAQKVNFIGVRSQVNQSWAFYAQHVSHLYEIIKVDGPIVLAAPMY